MQKPALALYRTYRPRTFKEVRGQEHVTEVLSAAVKNNTIAHAYLFAGTRGTGKTSVARIVAREIGCTEKDLYEMDAASNRGVDDVRELREGVYSLPFESPYKVYIIDEAHMLTKEAWNALLKTLEEPPSHVVFILATTELHKVPDTIQSRCETYIFREPSRDVIADAVEAVAKSEQCTLERSAADLIATLAEGSFRDALSILQKVLTISKDKNIDVTEVERVTGAPTGELLRTVIGALAARDYEAALVSVRTAQETNIDAKLFTRFLIQRVRNTLLLRLAPKMKESLAQEHTKTDFELIEQMAGDKANGITLGLLRNMLRAYEDISLAAVPYVPLELALMDNQANS